MSDDHDPSIRSKLLDHLRDDAWLRRLAQRLASKRDDADDVLQDVALAGLEHAPIEEARLAPWLVTVLRNRSRRFLRSFVRRQHHETRVATRASAQSGRSVSSEVEHREIQVIVARELFALEEPFRSTLIRRFFEDRSYAEIARMDRIEEVSVRWRQHRGLELLRQRLDARHRGVRDEWLRALLPFRLVPRPASASSLGVGIMKSKSFAIVSVALLVGVVAVLFKGREGGTAARPADRGYDAARLVVAPAVEVPIDDAPPTRELAKCDAESLLRSPIPKNHARIVARFVEHSAVGAPVRGARLIAIENEFLNEPRPSDPFATSDESGLAVLDLEDSGVSRTPIPRSFDVKLAYSAARFIGRIFSGLARTDAVVDLGTIALDDAGAVVGRVVDDAGHPLSNALVWPGGAFRQRTTSEGEILLASAVTDSEGRYRLDGLPLGFVELHAYWNADRSDDLLLTLPAGGELHAADLRIRARPNAASVFGSIHGPQGEALEGVYVSLREVATPSSSKPSRSYCVVSDRRGCFAADLDKGARFSLLAYDPQERVGFLERPDLAVDGRPLDLRFDRPSTWTLRVVDQLGAPVDPTFVQLSLLDGAGRTLETIFLSRSRRAVHDIGERKVNRPPGPFLLSVFAPGYSSANLGPLDPNSIGDELRCELTSPRKVRGIVVARGAPIAGARVCLAASAAPTMHPLVAGAFASHNIAPGPTVTAITGVDGRFEIAPSEPGPLRLHAAARGYGSRESEVFDYSPDHDLADFTIELPTAGSIDGVVVVDPGARLASRIVGASVGDGFVRTTRLDSEGRFRFEDLEPGSWMIAECRTEIDLDRGFPECDYPGWEFSPSILTTVDLAAGATVSATLDLRDRNRGTVRGVIRFLGEAPQPHRITLEPQQSDGSFARALRLETTLLPDGSYELSPPIAGTFRLTCFHFGGAMQFEKLLELKDGTNDFSFECQTGAIEIAAAPTVKASLPLQILRTDEERGIQYRLTGVKQPGKTLVLSPCFCGRGKVVLCSLANSPPRPDPQRESIDIDVPAGGTLRIELK